MSGGSRHRRAPLTPRTGRLGRVRPRRHRRRPRGHSQSTSQTSPISRATLQNQLAPCASNGPRHRYALVVAVVLIVLTEIVAFAGTPSGRSSDRSSGSASSAAWSGSGSPSVWETSTCAAPARAVASVHGAQARAPPDDDSASPARPTRPERAASGVCVGVRRTPGGYPLARGHIHFSPEQRLPVVTAACPEWSVASDARTACGERGELQPITS